MPKVVSASTIDVRFEVRLFKRYQWNHSPALRNQLIEMYLPLVKRVAQKIHARLPAEARRDDLESAGVLGLMNAIEEFDLGRKVRFVTFGGLKVRGAILDELREIDWVPRLVRKRARQIESAAAELRNQHSREPNEIEIASKLGWSDAETRKHFGVGRLATMRSIFRTTTDRDPFGEQLPQDFRSKNPIRDAQRNMLREVMERGLSRSERLILLLYYYEGLTMKEIGATLDLSESRVSQMHGLIQRNLQTRLNGRINDFTDDLAA